MATKVSSKEQDKRKKAAQKVWQSLTNDLTEEYEVKIRTGFLKSRTFKVRFTQMLRINEFGILYDYVRNGNVSQELRDYFNSDTSTVLPFFNMAEIDLTLGDLQKMVPFSDDPGTSSRFWYPCQEFAKLFEANSVAGGCVRWNINSIDDLTAKGGIPNKGNLYFPEDSTICFCKWREIR